MPRRALSRIALCLSALIQLVVPGLVGVADAHLAREGLAWRGASHIESHTQRGCPREHDVDCALCRHIATTTTRPARAPVPIAVASIAPLERVEVAAPAAAPDLSHGRPRAPPQT